jgi:hypothetical protein
MEFTALIDTFGRSADYGWMDDWEAVWLNIF